MEGPNNYRKALQDCEVIIKCPGSLLFFGEYSAVRDQPALTMGIPIFFELGADLTKNQKITFEMAYAQPQFTYNNLRKFGCKKKVKFRSGLVGDPGLETRLKSKLRKV